MVVQRHDGLRAAFWDVAGHGPLAIVARQAAWEYREEHVAESDTAGFAALRERERRRGFDLEAGTPLRIALVRRGPERHELLWNFHHIVLDGWSMGVLLAEVVAAYRALARGGAPVLPEAVSTREHLAWLAARGAAGARDYWRKYLEGVDEIASVPVLAEGSARDAAPVQRVNCPLPPAVGDALTKAAAEWQVTPSVVFQAAWAVLLGLYNRTDDVVFGATVSGRPESLRGAEKMVGLLINTVPVRVRWHARERLAEVARRLQLEQLAAREWEHVPLTEIQGGRKRFDHLVVFENYPLEASLAAATNDGLTIVPAESFEQIEYDLCLVIVPSGGGFEVRFLANGQRYSAESLRRVGEHFERVLRGAVGEGATNRAIGELAAGSETELGRARLFASGGGGGGPRLELVPERILRQAERRPAATALVSAGERWSYGELEARSNRLASHLALHAGAGAGDVVAIVCERGPRMVAAMLAVMKTGAAYLALDPGYPRERLRFMLEDASVAAAIVEPPYAALLPEAFDAPVIDLGRDAGRIAEHPAERAPLEIAPAQPAYLVYTSGSTGRPKGVLVEHRALAHLAAWHARYFEVTPRDRATQVASPAFDAAVMEIWGHLAAGAELHLVDAETRIDPVRLRDYWLTEKISIAFAPTPIGETLLKLDWPEDTALRRLFVGGDRLVSRPKASLPFELFNVYGPAEYTVASTTGRVEPAGAENPSVGRPLDRTHIFVVDRNLNPVAPGVVGEVLVGGDGLARGYLGQAGLTAERFVPDHLSGARGARLYRTGDLARWRADGSIDFVGRADQQVKINGVRIELSEIEHAFVAHPAIEHAAVVAENGELSACVVARAGAAQPTAEALHAHLTERLPRAVVPGRYVWLEALPLTANGKIDRRALRERVSAKERGGATAAVVALAGEHEAAVAAVWREVLGDAVSFGAEAHFFLIGGNSLQAMQAISRLRARGYAPSLQELYRRPVLREFAAALGDGTPSGAEASWPAWIARARVGTNPASPVVVLFHQVLGAGLSYFPLIGRLPQEHSVYVVESPALREPGRRTLGSVAGMARVYADALRGIEPGRPLVLAGHSLGGLMAIEVARRLRTSGRDVRRVIVMDTLPEGGAHQIVPAAKQALAEVIGMAEAFASGGAYAHRAVRAKDDLRAPLRAAAERLERAGFVGAGEGEAFLLTMARVYRGNCAAAAAYRMRRYEGEVVVLATADVRNRMKRRRAQDWRTWIDGRCKIVAVRGEHMTMLGGKFLAGTAKAVTANL